MCAQGAKKENGQRIVGIAGTSRVAPKALLAS